MFEKLLASPSLKRFSEAILEGHSLVAEELWDAPKAVLATQVRRITGRQVVIISGGARESRLFDDFPFFTDERVVEFPAWETLPSEAVPPSPDIVGERYSVLHQLLSADPPALLLCPLQACLQRLLPAGKLREQMHEIRVGEELPFTDFIQQLESMGFERRSVAADKGEFAVRGGIIDLFPVDSPDPFRLEFVGDELESIRRYDPVGQRSVGPADRFTLLPAKEAELLAPLLDYLGPKPILIFDDLLALEDRYVALESLPGAISRSFVSFHDFLDETRSLQKLYLTATALEELGEVEVLDGGGGAYSAEAKPRPVRFSIFDQKLEARRWHHQFRPLPEEIVGDRVVCVAETEAERDYVRPLLPKQTQFVQGYLSSGFALEDLDLLLVPTTELTHRHKVRRRKQRSTYHTPPSEFRELQEGELVVHYEHGIGRYLGVEKRRDYTGTQTECLAVEYAEKGKLFVPLTQSHLLSRYIGSHEQLPRLHKLGGGRWARTRMLTEQAIRDYAAQLLKMHAEREMAGGFAFPKGGDELIRFEQEFPYEETEDQLQAIQAARVDMQASQPMDRLICGDVGYGKTEVAMRAAFHAVEAGKQVAVLVPTTVLAMQHFETFSDRMANFPINLAVLSRFRTAKQIREALEGVSSGSVDILIGTHRIISKDVTFRNLGLVVIDEEQRFGVRVKEKLRSFRAGVDCLTLTATPIPRTLYMALMGARELSVIQTPPQDRLPIKTIICDADDDRMKAALLRELARDGQAYVIHNRVETIDLMASRIRSLLPQARVLVAHGQMSAGELDTVFHTFKMGQADILVATTIVENGIDIPNANTILIDRSDRYGLADLYQLRGRVGRWSRRAYAYFLTPKHRALAEIAEQRLRALLDISGYGGGMKLAMRDLELRGAGNILGVEQSGHVSRIGFNLYCRLLKRTINGLQGKQAETLEPIRLEFPQPARLPEGYIAEATLRMEFYQRFGEATSENELQELVDEVRDRFGPPPKPVVWLHHLMRIRIDAARYSVTALRLKNMTLQIDYRSRKRHTAIIGSIKTPEELEKKVKALLREGHGGRL